MESIIQPNNAEQLTELATEARTASMMLARFMLDALPPQTQDIVASLHARGGWRVAVEVGVVEGSPLGAVALTMVSPKGERQVLAEIAATVAPAGLLPC